MEESIRPCCLEIVRYIGAVDVANDMALSHSAAAQVYMLLTALQSVKHAVRDIAERCGLFMPGGTISVDSDELLVDRV